jgi:hypothetical protein
MNDVFAVVFCVIFALAILAVWAYFNTYYGVYDSLSNATPGSVYNFIYAQPLTGTFDRYLAKVMLVHKLSPPELKRLNKRSTYRQYDDMFERSPTLIECQMADGTFRKFYAERASHCRRSMVGRLLFTCFF